MTITKTLKLDKNTEIFNFGEKGVVTATEETIGLNYWFFVVKHYSKDLELIDSLTLSDQKFDIASTILIEGNYFYLFLESKKKNRIVRIDVESFDFTEAVYEGTHKYFSEKPIVSGGIVYEPFHNQKFEMIRKYDVVKGSFEDIKIELLNHAPKNYYVQEMLVDPLTNRVNLLCEVDTKTGYLYYLYALPTTGQSAEIKTLETDGSIELRSMELFLLEGKKLMAVGNYRSHKDVKKKDAAQGMYFCRLDDSSNQKVINHSFGGLKCFYDFLPDDMQDRKDFYKIEPTSLFESNNSLMMIFEAYIPIVYSSTKGSGTSLQTFSAFVGNLYTHFMIASVSLDGKIGWQQCHGINTGEWPMYLIDQVDLQMNDSDTVTLSYLDFPKLKRVAFNSEWKIMSQQETELKCEKTDYDLTEYFHNFQKWYGNTYYSHYDRPHYTFLNKIE